MNDMIEILAKAFWDAEPDAFNWSPSDRNATWEDAVAQDLVGVPVFRHFARVALTAMRNPSARMKMTFLVEMAKHSDFDRAYVAMIEVEMGQSK